MLIGEVLLVRREILTGSKIMKKEIPFSTWKEDQEKLLIGFAEYVFDLQGKGSLPDNMLSGDWDEQFIAWENSIKLETQGD